MIFRSREARDRKIGLAADKMKRAAVGAAEIQRGQFGIGFGDEIAIAEEQQLDATAQFVFPEIEQETPWRLSDFKSVMLTYIGAIFSKCHALRNPEVPPCLRPFCPSTTVMASSGSTARWCRGARPRCMC